MTEAIGYPERQEAIAKVLMNDSIPVSRALAAEYGNNAAKFVQQLHYWLNTESGEVIGGIRWIFNTLQDWADQLGVSVGTIKRIKKRLFEDGIIKVERLRSHRWKQTNWYTIDYDRLKMIQSTGSSRSTPLDQNDPITANNTPQIKTDNKTVPPTHPVKNEQEWIDPTPQQTPDQPATQTALTADPTAETAFRAISEADIPLNTTIQQMVIATIAQFGAVALERIQRAAGFAAAAPQVHKKTGKPTNRAAIFVDALKNPHKYKSRNQNPISERDSAKMMNVDEPVPAASPERSQGSEPSKLTADWKEWRDLAYTKGIIDASQIHQGRFMVLTSQGWQDWEDVRVYWTIQQLRDMPSVRSVEMPKGSNERSRNTGESD